VGTHLPLAEPAVVDSRQGRERALAPAAVDSRQGREQVADSRPGQVPVQALEAADSRQGREAGPELDSRQGPGPARADSHPALAPAALGDRQERALEALAGNPPQAADSHP